MHTPNSLNEMRKIYNNYSLQELLHELTTLTLDSDKKDTSSLPCGLQDYYAQREEEAIELLPVVLETMKKFPLNDRLDLPHWVFVAIDKS